MCKFIILFLILISVIFIGGENIIIKYTEDSIIEGARSKSKSKFKLSDLGKKKFYKNTAKSIQKSKI